MQPCQYVDLHGAGIAYRVSGSGPALVLMRNNRHHELRLLAAPTLVYVGTDDKAIGQVRRLRPVLEGIGCGYLEFDALDHRASGLDDPSDSGRLVAQGVAD